MHDKTNKSLVVAFALFALVFIAVSVGAVYATVAARTTECNNLGIALGLRTTVLDWHCLVIDNDGSIKYKLP